MSEKEIQYLGIAAHGMLAGLHAISAFYNFRRKNYRDALIHTLVLAYDGYAVYNHSKSVQEYEREHV